MNHLVINTKNRKNVINRNIYGHFSEHLGRCIYGGLYVGEDSPIPNVNGMRLDVVDALRHINIPVLRWPGGCFADEYHWKDGIGPRESRKRMVNTHWGGVVEDNSFGTHEFMELCRQLGCEPYVNGNLGSGTVQEMSEWVEYMTFSGESPMARLRESNGQKDPWSMKYFGVGNENWGCGGNMRPEYYADLYRQFQTYVRSYGDNKVYKIACGANGADYNWTRVLMQNAKDHMDALTLHYYTTPTGNWDTRGKATGFTKDIYYDTLKRALFMNELVENNVRIMDYHDPQNNVGLIVDEWGSWYDVEDGTNPGFLYQQNTMRDALVAAVTLNCFNRQSRRVVMANLAQTVNVLQAVVLTEGSNMLLTPTYHVFDLYKGHMDSTLVESFVDCAQTGVGDATVPVLDVSASVAQSGEIHITLANLDADKPQEIVCSLPEIAGKTVTARIVAGEVETHNTFDDARRVSVCRFEEIYQNSDSFSLTMPACSVLEIVVA